ELAFRIPAAKKQDGTQGKALLRSLAQRRLPGRLWQLPKRGFTAPIGDWIAGPQAGQFRDEVLRSTAITATHLDYRELQSRFLKHQNGEHDSGYALWAVWVLERWLTRKDKPALATTLTTYQSANS